MMMRDSGDRGDHRGRPAAGESRQNDEALAVADKIQKIIAEAELRRQKAHSMAAYVPFFAGAAVATASICASTLVFHYLGLLGI